MSLNTPENRVAVANDVLLRLKAKKIKPMTMGYIAITLEEPLPGGIREARDIVDLPMKECHVCHLGALFLSKARLFDNCPIDAEHFQGSTHPPIYNFWSLTDVFSFNQLKLMERAYERWSPNGVVNDYDLEQRAFDFGMKYKKTSTRMRAICRNIIENNGEFVP